MSQPLMSEPLYLASELRALEVSAQAGLAPGTLMDRAGEAIARAVMMHAAAIDGPVVALAGPGNNGGDALTAALVLRHQGIAVRVILLADPASFGGEAARAWSRWSAAGGASTAECLLEEASVVLDGLYGIGLNRAPSATAARWIGQLNEWQARTGRPVLALDIPSGLMADTGQVLGSAVRATHTLTFLGRKPGLYTADGPDHCGAISLETLGVTGGAASGILTAPEDFAEHLPRRPQNSNKGQFGNLGVLAGAPGMVGAGILCARMGLMGGAGRVYLHLPGAAAPGIDWNHPELMLRDDLALTRLSAAVIGPGLGDPPAALAECRALLATATATVLDADALNAVAGDAALAASVAARSGPTLITPHPLEAARLLGCDVGAVQADRIAAARRLATTLSAWVVLKGAGSVLAGADGRWAINPTGNPGLASAGTGDVLAGLLGALLAQGMAPWPALLAAVWLHGRAADRLVEAGVGPIGLTASELLPVIRSELNAWAQPRRARSAASGYGRFKNIAEP